MKVSNHMSGLGRRSLAKRGSLITTVISITLYWLNDVGKSILHELLWNWPLVNMNLNQSLKGKSFPESNPDEVAHVVKVLEEFTMNSSIHGIKNLGKKNRSSAERIFWFILIALGAIGSFIGIIMVWKHWSKSPTIIIVDEDQDFSDVPFPGVTVCTDLKIEGESFVDAPIHPGLSENIHEYFANLHPSSLEAVLVEISSVFAPLLDPDLKIGEYKFERSFSSIIRKQKDVGLILAMGLPACSNIILDCVWRGKQYSNCMELFKVRLTDSGFCCSFNTKLPEEVINYPQQVNLETIQSENKLGNSFVSSFIFESVANAGEGIGPFAAGNDPDYYHTYYDDPQSDYMQFLFDYDMHHQFDYSPWYISEYMDDVRLEIEACQAQLLALNKANPKTTLKDLQFRMSYTIEDDEGIRTISGNEILFNIEDMDCIQYFDTKNSTKRQMFQECNAQIAGAFAANPNLKRHHFKFLDSYAIKEGDHIVHVPYDEILFNTFNLDCKDYLGYDYGYYGYGGGSPPDGYQYSPPTYYGYNPYYDYRSQSSNTLRKDTTEKRVRNKEAATPFMKCLAQLKRMYQANTQTPAKDLINQTEYRIRSKAKGKIYTLPKDRVLFNPETMTCPQPEATQNDPVKQEASDIHQSRKLQSSQPYFPEDQFELPTTTASPEIGTGPQELRLVVHRGVLPDINNIYGEGYDYVNVPTWENARVAIHAPDEIPQMNGGSSFALIRGQDHIVRVGATVTHASESLKSSGFGSRHCVLDSDKEEDLRPYGVSKYGLKRYTASGCLLGCRATKVSEICNLPFPLFPLYEGVRPGPDTLEDLKAGHLCLNANKTEMLAFMGEELREKCECPPACQETQYDLEVRESPLDSHKEVFNDLETSNPRFMTFGYLHQDARFIQSASLIKMINQRYDRLKEDLAIIHIAMEPTKMEKQIRRKVLTLWEVLGIMGGLAALFLGCSVMACCEMLYYLVFRTVFKWKKAKKEQIIKVTTGP